MKHICACLSLFVAVSVTGCVSHENSTSGRAKTSMIGMSREQVLQCAGVPQGTMKVGDTEVWKYAGEGGMSAHLGSNGNIDGETALCQVAVLFQGDEAKDVRFASNNTGLLKGRSMFNAIMGEQYPVCARIIAPCASQ